MPDPTGYSGVVIAKRRADEPVTEEPVVYAYAKIVQKRRPVVALEVVLGLAEDKDRVTRYAFVPFSNPVCRGLLTGMQ